MARRRLVALALALPALALAQADTVAVWDDAGKVITEAKKLGPGWTPSKSLQGVTVGRTFMMPAPVGAGASLVAANATVNLSAKGVFALAGRAILNPYLAAGMAVAPLAVAAWAHYRCRAPAYALANELECDAGALPPMVLQPCYHFGGPQCFGSLDAAALARLPAYGYEEVQVQSVTCGPLAPQQNCPGNTIVYFSWKDTSNVAGGGRSSGWRGADWLGRGLDTQGAGPCPQVGGTHLHSDSPGFDGKCYTVAGHVPVPEAQAVEKPVAYPNPAMTDAAWTALTAQALARLDPPLLASLPGDTAPLGELRVNVMDSTPVPGPTVNTTNSDGSSESQVTVWNIGRVNDAIRDKETSKWVATKTTTKTSPTGVVTTSTTTDSGAASTTAPSASGAAGSLCDGAVGTVACTQMGEGDEAAPDLQVEERGDYTQATGFGADTAACPASRPIITARGPSMSFDYAGVCQYVAALRPLVIAAAALSAAFIIVGVRTDE